MRVARAAAVLAILSTVPSRAAEVDEARQGVIRVTGIIREGDASLLGAVMGHAATVRPTVVLDSPGGDAAEAVRMAREVRLHGADTVVADGSRCASACFLVFAAGARKRLGPASTLAVHGAAEVDGSVTPRIVALDAVMRRASQAYGVPRSVTRRMSVAYGRELYVLGPDDLRAMRVESVVQAVGHPASDGDVRTLLGPTIR